MASQKDCENVLEVVFLRHEVVFAESSSRQFPRAFFPSEVRAQIA